jgi:ABC-type Fe3+ transport system permease subunit
VTDKNDKPLPDLPVLFSLGDPCLGSLAVAGVAAGAALRKKTDKRGIAAVVLTAGASKCAASITARVEGTNASVELKATVQERQGFWSARNTLIVAAVAAAAGIGIGLAVANSGNNTPIRPVPPINVKP